MANTFFRFKQFTVHQDRCAMKVTTDGCLFGAWVAAECSSLVKEGTQVLDIGTGTGLLSLMLAQVANCSILAMEIDDDACGQAKENIAGAPWSDNITVICGDIREPNDKGAFEIIISNPPFYENELKSDDEKKNLAHHGNQLAMADLLQVIRAQLSPRGSFFLLVPYKRWEEIQQLINDHGLMISTAVVVRQSVKHAPFRVMIKGTFRTEEQALMNVTGISVWDENQQYTAEFKTLLSPYYLAL
jgi:tRNA1Val (adenine37-N6)-methyltransferase